MKEKLKKYVYGKFRHYPKTKEITELRDELYSMTCDKYEDCLSNGMNENDSYKEAVKIMCGYKAAIRETEKGSSYKAFKRKLINLLAFTAAYYLALTCIYLGISLIHGFEDKWIIMVGGAFVYTIYITVMLFLYSKMFGHPVLKRVAMGGIFASLVPILYVYPSMLCDMFANKNIWDRSWLIVPAIVLVSVAVDMIVYRANKKALKIEALCFGLLVCACVYLTLSMLTSMWHVTWMIFVIYVTIVAFILYLGAVKSDGK